MAWNRTKCFSVFGFVGLIFLISGCVMIPEFNNLIHSEINDQIPLKNGSESFKTWSAPPVPIYFQVWVYDVVNYMEVQKGEKPVLVQKGPYTYREKRHKKGIIFNKNGTMDYRETRTFFFEPSMSVGPEEDTFHCINLVMMQIFEMIKTQGLALKEIVDFVLETYKETLFVKISVKDIMWGYSDPFLTEVLKLAKRLHLNIPIPEKIGLFYNQNGTDDGVYSIYSGQAGVDKVGEIVSWNNQMKLDTWTTSIANMINGSDGTMYPPFIDVGETKYLFSSDLCRSLGMEHVGGVTKRGISLERFAAPDILFGNVSINPYNAGFCTPAGNCLPSGLLNVSSCRQGAPIVMSMPNFLGCDPDIINSVIGLHPNQEEHQSYLDIEPMTGVVMNAGKRLQINIVLEKIDGFSETENIKHRIYLPMMWLNESALIDEKDARKFKTEVLDTIKLTQGIKYSLIALGCVFLLILLISLLQGRLNRKNKANDEQKSLLNGHTQDSYMNHNGIATHEKE